MANADAAFWDSLPALPPRPNDAHKGTFGTAALVGGSSEMSGAIRLAGRAALHAGAGLVRLLVPKPIETLVAAETPESMTVGVAADRNGRIALDALGEIVRRLDGASAFGVGPGLGRSLGLDVLAPRLFFETPRPGVFDADALNALSAREIFCLPDERKRFEWPGTPWKAPRILTPHPGEFARMTGVPTPQGDEERKEAASAFVRRVRAAYGDAPLILVLKGAGTVVTDGRRLFVNRTGNPGMATGGSGDVLTGVLTALFARKLDPFDAAVLAVALHAAAGDAAAERLGQDALTASSLIDSLPDAFAQLAHKGHA